MTEVEIGDDGAEYGVEVRLSDGRQVEVHLDAAFTVTGDESDDDSEQDQRGDTVMRSIALIVVAVVGIGIALSGCVPARTGSSDGVAPTDALPQGSDPVELDPSDFTTAIDNPYWPMSPGSRWTYRETDEEGNVLEVVVTVSSETREIANGVAAVIVRDTVTQDGQVIEDTFDWYAQDADGNVWYLGEDTAEFEDGAVSTTAGSFEAGVDGALPGIVIPANPQNGMRYRQEYYAGEAEDNGEVLSTEEQAEVAFGHFTDVLLTKDTITNQPDVLEYKLYAPEVGPVLVIGVSGGGGREELVSFESVGAETARLAGTTPLGDAYP